ncbi:MAG: hypothetical protein NTY19_22040 [Planctomycetota bacterium]|nr:hypothetical protein [Planctomycetota bacterium]
MSEASKSVDESAKKQETPSFLPQPDRVGKAPSRIFLVPYPKIVFLYPSFLVAVIAAIYMSVFHWGLKDPEASGPVVIAEIFLFVLAINLVILAFDFPRTTSLTLFFFGAAVLLGFILLVTLRPNVLPGVLAFLKLLHPVANATFYCTFATVLGLIFLAVLINVRFDYWEVRPNELLHHHGVLSNLERFSAPNLRIEKEINDVFEYFLLRSGRLLLHASDDRRSIVLDNVPFIWKKEEAITRMLGALQVQVRNDNAG